MKKIISIITILVLVFTINIDTYALTSSKYRDMMDSYRNFVDKVTITPDELLDFMDTALTSVGINLKPYSSGGHAFDNSKNSIHQIDPNIDSNSTITDVKNWITQHIDVTDNSITVDNDFRDFIINYYNGYNDVHGSGWAYGDPLSNEGRISNSWLEAFRNWRTQSDKDNIFIIMDSSSQYINPRVLVLPKQNYFFVYVDTDGNGVSRFTIGKNAGSGTLWRESHTVYKVDLSNNTFVSDGSTDITTNSFYVYAGKDGYIDLQITGVNRNFFMASDEALPNRIIYYYGASSGVDQNYNVLTEYKNTEIWNDFSTSSGDWTFSPSNTNTVNYGDTTTYINNYYEDNDYYPDQSVVNQWIGDQNIINNDDGGGSGSGDDSGGGSGSDDDDSGSIFDWLKNLGKVLGDLIKGVGEFITEIIAGLVSALNDLMSSLSGLITDTLGSLTTVFSSIIDFVYAGLPDSVKGIMMLALTVSLLITVIQLIRK